MLRRRRTAFDLSVAEIERLVAPPRKTWWQKLREPNIVISLASSLVALLAICVSYQSMRISAFSTEAARKEYLSLNRPWVVVEVAQVSDIHFDAKGASFFVEFTMQNTGNTPAVDVELYVLGDVELQGAHGNHSAPASHLRSVAADFMEEKIGSTIKGTLFPRKIVRQRHAIFVPIQEIAKMRGKGLSFAVYGLVDYNSPLGALRHRQTMFQHTVARGIGDGRSEDWSGNESFIDSANIVVFESGTGGFSAN